MPPPPILKSPPFKFQISDPRSLPCPTQRLDFCLPILPHFCRFSRIFADFCDSFFTGIHCPTKNEKLPNEPICQKTKCLQTQRFFNLPCLPYEKTNPFCFCIQHSSFCFQKKGAAPYSEPRLISTPQNLKDEPI